MFHQSTPDIFNVSIMVSKIILQ